MIADTLRPSSVPVVGSLGFAHPTACREFRELAK
jgi:hypothetical protein